MVLDGGGVVVGNQGRVHWETDLWKGSKLSKSGEKCPREGERPGRRLAARLMDSRSSKGCCDCSKEWGEVREVTGPHHVESCHQARTSPRRDSSPGRNTIHVFKGWLWHLAWLDSEGGGHGGSGGACEEAAAYLRWQLSVVTAEAMRSGQLVRCWMRFEDGTVRPGGGGCRWSLFVGKEQAFRSCWVWNAS